MPRRSTVLMVSILSLYFVLHTALARSRWSPHSGFWLIVLRGTKQLYFHFIGLFFETISGQRSTVLDLKKEKKKNPRYSYGLNWRDKQAVQFNGFFGKVFFFFLICFLRVHLYLCIYLFLYLSIYIFYLTIFQRWIFFKVLACTLREL